MVVVQLIRGQAVGKSIAPPLTVAKRAQSPAARERGPIDAAEPQGPIGIFTNLPHDGAGQTLLRTVGLKPLTVEDAASTIGSNPKNSSLSHLHRVTGIARQPVLDSKAFPCVAIIKEQPVCTGNPKIAVGLEGDIMHSALRLGRRPRHRIVYDLPAAIMVLDDIGLRERRSKQQDSSCELHADLCHECDVYATCMRRVCDVNRT